MGRSGNPDCTQRIFFHICIIIENALIERGAGTNTVAIVNCHGRIIDWIDRNRYEGLIAVSFTVIDFECKTVWVWTIVV